MLFKLPISTDIITIPNRFAKIKSVVGDTGSRTFTYNFRLKLDVTKALNADALTLDIRLLEKKPEKSKIKPAAIIPSLFKANTLKLENTTQKKKKTSLSLSLAFQRSDITDVIPNTEAKEIATGKKIFTKAIKRAPVPTINSAVYQLPISSSLSPTKKVSLSKISHAFISTQRDPAQLVSFRNSPPAALSFLAPVPAMMAKNVMFRAPKKAITPTIFTLFLRTAELSRTILLTESALKSRSSFYLQVKLRNSKGVTVAEAGTIVSHAKILNDFMTPTIAPELSISQISTGEMSIGVKQLDEKATRVKLFRRIAPSDNDQGTGWSLILDDDLESGTGEIRFRDRVASFNPIMYRAICLGENSRPAERFASGIITPRQEIKKDYSGKGTATAAIEGETIRVSVSDFPKNAIMCGVRRYNLTLNSYADFQAQTAAGFFNVGATPDDVRQFISDPEDVIEFYDSPEVGMMYRYMPISYTLYGKEILGKPALIDYISAKEDAQKVSMTVGQATLTSNKTSHSVSFSTSGEFTDFGFEEISSVLDDADQAGMFLSSISSNRDKFSSLIVFLIERENTITGEVETFGIQEDSTSFTDNTTSREANNVKDFVEGTRYVYKVISCLRPAESLFPELTKTDVDITTLSTFTRAVQKFRGPLQLRKSTLASTARQLNNSVPSALEPLDPFIAGRTSVQATVEVMIPAPVSLGSGVTVETRMDNNRIKWVYDGDMSKIDHFQIFLTSGGGYELLGTIHADFSSMNYSYRHFVSEDIPFDANYSYEIKPITIDFKEKEVMKTSTIIANQFPGISQMELSNAVMVFQR